MDVLGIDSEPRPGLMPEQACELPADALQRHVGQTVALVKRERALIEPGSALKRPAGLQAETGALDRGGPHVAAISRSAPGWISHSNVPRPGPGESGKLTSAAPPFL